MSRILKVSESDYRVKVQDGGTITLDSGVNTPVIPTTWTGGVVITGDLLVMGDTTTVSTTNLDIEDNIISLNVGEEGAGVTEGSSGIRIDRGQTYRENTGDLTPDPYDVFILFDENISHWNPVTSSNTSGTFVAKLSNNEKTGLQVSTLVGPASGLDLIFDMQSDVGVLKLANTSNYSLRVTDDNHIPNRRWVTDYIQSGEFQVGQADVDRYYQGALNPLTGEMLVNAMGIAKNEGSNPSLEFYIRNAGDGVESLRAKIINTGLYVDGVQIFGSTIGQHDSLDNLILTAANNNVEVDAVFNLNDQAAAPGGVVGTTRIYSRAQLTPQLSQYPGKTGIFFTNQVNTDELVSKNRALLFSMIF